MVACVSVRNYSLSWPLVKHGRILLRQVKLSASRIKGQAVIRTEYSEIWDLKVQKWKFYSSKQLKSFTVVINAAES